MSINLKELSSEFNNLKLDYDLKKKNWFNIGGKTKVFFKPESLKDLMSFLKEFGKNNKLNTGIFRAGCITGPNHSGAKLHGFLSYLVKTIDLSL